MEVRNLDVFNMKLKTKGYNETVRELKHLMNNSDVLEYFEELVKMIEIQVQ